MANAKKIVVSVPENLLQEFDGLRSGVKMNRSEFIREAIKFYIATRKRRTLSEDMKKGYQEMAELNLAIARECFKVENEAHSYNEDQFVECK